MDHLYTFKELAGYVTITGCMAFSIGFLIAAYTRIFKHDDENVSKKNILVRSKFPE